MGAEVAVGRRSGRHGRAAGTAKLRALRDLRAAALTAADAAQILNLLGITLKVFLRLREPREQRVKAGLMIRLVERGVELADLAMYIGDRALLVRDHRAQACTVSKVLCLFAEGRKLVAETIQK